MGKFKLIVFDIDGTLTQSKLPLDNEMAELLSKLLRQRKVAIISGAGFEQFKWQILEKLSEKSPKLDNLYLLPTDGTAFCVYKNGWQCESDPPLSQEDKEKIKKVFENIFEKSRLENPKEVYGEIVEDRGAQLNFSALGQDAPIEIKENWDPDNKKRQKIVSTIKDSLSGFSLRIGGTTSIEITKEGIDKAYGLKKLTAKLMAPKESILYIGDKLIVGGNDEPILALGIEYRAVGGLDDTRRVIYELIREN